MESDINEVASQPVSTSQVNLVPNNNGEIRGSDIYSLALSERIVSRRRGRPATSRGRGVGRGLGYGRNVSVDEYDMDHNNADSDAFSDSDDEDYDVNLEIDAANDVNEAYDNPNNDAFYLEDYVESDGSDFSFEAINEEDEVGQVFDDVDAFRAALRDYAVHGGYILKKEKNDKVRVVARCINENCNWRIRASRLQDGITFMVKVLGDEHGCMRPEANENPSATTKWIGKKLKVLLGNDPNCTYESMEGTLKEVWGIEPERWKLYRARNMARDGDDGIHAESYKQLNKWIVGVQKSNPGTCIKLEYQPRDNLDEAPQFKRIFVCFEGMKRGFLAGCRPFIGLDGCHLKGPFGGVLLAAVSMDGDNGIFPFAIGIVEAESNSSWGFFLESLKSCIDGRSEDIPYTFMSDRQKGIIDAVRSIFPLATHRHCAQHLWMNFKAKFPGSGLRKEFWKAVKATSGFEFWAVMRSMKDKLEERPYNWLMALPLSQWSRHHYWPQAKSEHPTNNMTESFNSWILKIRGRPIVPLLDAYRKKCMVRLHKRHGLGCAMEGKLVPNAKEKINKVINEARQCRLIPARNDEFEVKDGNARFAVSMTNKKCSCQWWDISGIPCKHATLSIGYMRGKIENYVSDYFTVATYMKAYEGVIHPLPNYEDVIGDEVQEIIPPPLKRLPGRPRVSRRRQEGEEQASATRRRFSTVTCHTCKQLGHNRKTCTRAPQDQRAPRYNNSQPGERTTSTISQTAAVGASTSRGGSSGGRGSSGGSSGGRGSRGGSSGGRGSRGGSGRGRGSKGGSSGGRGSRGGSGRGR